MMKKELARVGPEFQELESRLLLSGTVATITVFATDSAAAETSPGVRPNPGAFTITRTGPITATTPALTVGFAVTGSAASGVNYEGIGTSAVIPQGKASVVVPVTPLNDLVADPTLTVILSLQPSANYTITPLPAKQAAHVNILDNSPVVSIKASDAAAAETASGVRPNPGAFTITRTGPITPATAALAVRFAVNGTADSGTDYVDLGTSAVIPQGKASVVVPVAVLDDLDGEPTETVIVTMVGTADYNVSPQATKAGATVKIQDNEPVLRLSAKSAAPGATLTLSSRFAPDVETHVDFVDADGRAWTVAPSTLTASKLLVPVPMLLDFDTGQTCSGVVWVRVRQETVGGTMTTLPAGPLAINDLPETGVTAGALTQRFLQGMQDIIQKAIDQYQTVGSASGGTVDTTDLVDQLQALQDAFAAQEQTISPLLDGTETSVEIGQHDGKSILLDSNALGLVDRMIAGLILGRKGSAPVTTASAHLARAAVLSASVAPDPFGLLQNLGDQFTHLLSETVPNDILAFAQKYQALGNVAFGGVVLAGVLLTLAELPIGVPVATAGVVLGAMWYGVSTFAPAAIAISLEGGSNVLVGRNASWANFEPTAKFVGSSTISVLLSQGISRIGELSGGAGQVVAESINVARSIRDLVARDDPASVRGQIHDNWKLLRSSLYPPAGTATYVGTGTLSLTCTTPNPGWTPDPYTITGSSTVFSVRLVTSRSLLSPGSFTGTFTLGAYTLTYLYPAQQRSIAPYATIPAFSMDSPREATPYLWITGTTDGRYMTMTFHGWIGVVTECTGTISFSAAQVSLTIIGQNTQEEADDIIQWTFVFNLAKA